MVPSVPPDSSAPCYVETLSVPLRWWAVATMLWASFLLAFLVAVPAAVALLAAGVLFGLTALVFLSWGGARISVVDGELRAGRAHIAVDLLAEPAALDAEETARVAGVDADARAYLLLRPYLSRSVRVRLVDPADPTPYWLLSTRHAPRLADELAAAIARSRASGGR